jgi:tRNA(Ile)-lysidine synthase
VIEQFLNHIQQNHLCKTNDKILLAVSGGIDSMVMLHLFVKAGFNPAVAHCNFGLRPGACDLDEAFVKEESRKNGLQFYSTSFDTDGIARDNNASIQLTARRLRYDFFQRVCQEHGFEKIATAHNANDNLETVLLNLTRGTGLEGLGGIPVRNENVIRPLLFASRKMISNYAMENNISWREDESNERDDYSRNNLRHHVIPKLQELNPNLEDTFNSSIERIGAGIGMAQAFLEELYRKMVSEDGATLAIAMSVLRESPYPAVVLWEFLKQYGFNFETCKRIVEPHQAGKQFYAGDKVLTVDRDRYLLTSIASVADAVVIQLGQSEAMLDKVKLLVGKAPDRQITSDPYVAQLDYDKVAFPLIWRKWRPGDSFVPLGMTSSKKISDLLTDAKIPLPQKDNVTVLQSGSDIIWVVGLRIHDSYKVTSRTTNTLIIEMNSSYT